MTATSQYQLLPDLSPDEYERLKADIAERLEVLVPVDLDEDGTVLDGHHRIRAYNELRAAGVPVQEYARFIRRGMTEQQKRSHVRAVNIIRRHLTQEQRRDLIAEQLRDTPEQSDSVVGQLLGVDDKTVQSVRSDLESTSEIPKLDRRIGKDGKSRPAKRESRGGPIIATSDHETQRTLEALADLPDGILPTNGIATATDVQRAAKEYRREEKRDANRALVDGALDVSQHVAGRVYQAIVLDPPWDWGDEGDADQFGRARPTYDTMPISEIAALPIGGLASVNAHVYLWITNRSLPKGFALLEAWGFRYVTMLTWAKPSIGMGNYYRGSTEHVLFGVRGSLPLLRRDVGTWFSAPRPDRHSVKPESFYELVESCSPGPWLELFARRERPGWVHWGAEVKSHALHV